VVYTQGVPKGVPGWYVPKGVPKGVPGWCICLPTVLPGTMVVYMPPTTLYT